MSSAVPRRRRSTCSASRPRCRRTATAKRRPRPARRGRSRGHPLFILLHGSSLAAILIAVPWDTRPQPVLLGAFVLLQPVRLWIILALGGRWTTRVVVVPGAPLVRRGPFRLLRHPNYAVVSAEIALLPLAFGAWRIALAWSLLNALLLAWRIRVEEAALAGAATAGAEKIL